VTSVIHLQHSHVRAALNIVVVIVTIGIMMNIVQIVVNIGENTRSKV